MARSTVNGTRLFSRFLVPLLFLVPVFTGCRSAAEQRFLAADAQLCATYVAIAQPAALDRADELAASADPATALQGAELRKQLALMGPEMIANAQSKARMATNAGQALDAAMAAIDLAEKILGMLQEPGTGNNSPGGAP